MPTQCTGMAMPADLNREPFCCETTVFVTAPLCHLLSENPMYQVIDLLNLIESIIVRSLLNIHGTGVNTF